jgi:hypothetical protein
MLSKLMDYIEWIMSTDAGFLEFAMRIKDFCIFAGVLSKLCSTRRD